jgi:N,N-dimethylformamidase beta subunit-like protein
MRRPATALIAAAVAAGVSAPAGAAAELQVKPREFSPLSSRLAVTVALPKSIRVGVQLQSRAGKPLGWIAKPARRRYLRLSWNGRIAGADVPDGTYRVRLVAGGRTLDSAPLRLDGTAPLVSGFYAHNRGHPFAGDTRMLTTISPNGDHLRDIARIRFRLNEPAQVRFEVARTLSAPETIYELTARLKAGANAFTWFPRKDVGARTYLVRLTVEDRAGNRHTYGAADATYGRQPKAPVIRVLGVDAGFTQESYSPTQIATLAVETDAQSFQLQVFRAGQEDVPTYSDTIMNGAPVTEPVAVPWADNRDGRFTLPLPIGPWGSGLYFAKLTADDGRIGYAPFIVRPATFGTSRVAVVLPTNTWQAYNFRDENGNGWGDTWYARGRENTVRLGRPFVRRGVPPQYRKYDLGFQRWLNWTGKLADTISESDLELIGSGDDLAKAYDLVVFPGHTEYVTRHEFDIVQRFRDLGGNLIFLSANNFFWEVQPRGRTLTRIKQWRELGRPEAALIGVQYRANDRGRLQKPFLVRSSTTASWLWAGTGLADGSALGEELGGYGIEIDQTTPESPPGTLVLADIADLFGPGLTAQMTYYETSAGAKVFAAGAIDFGGTATLWPVRHVLENLWARLATP